MKTAAAAPRAPALRVFSPLPKTPQQNRRACNGCQTLLAQGLFSLPEREKHVYGRLWQQSKTSTSEDMQHLYKRQHCSPALPAPTAAPPRLGQLLAFLICDDSGLCQGTAAVQEREEGKGPCADAASIPTSQCTVLQWVVLTGDFRLLPSSLMPPPLQCSSMPFAMARLYMPATVSLQ